MLEVDIDKRLKDFHLRTKFAVADEFVVLFGPSGSGKSMTLQCIAGLANPDAGRITIGEQVVFDSQRGVNLSPQKRRVGYVFQNYALFPHLTVAQNIGYGLHRLEGGERRQKVARMVELMRLRGLESRHPGELSGGQQQRVALARALVLEPSVLLLDEPFSALDSAVRNKLRIELLQLVRGLNTTTLFVTHNLEEAYTLSDKVVVYDEGQVLQVGTRDEVVYKPASRSVARFTGAKNIFSGTVTDATDEHLEIESEGLTIMAPPSDGKKGARVEFCIRPEHIMLLRPDRASAEGVKDNRLEGRIVQEIMRGPSVTLLFKVAALPNDKYYDLEIEVPSHVYQELDLQRKRQWAVSLKKSRIYVF